MDESRVLTRVEVKELFGRFNHRVEFPASDSFVIIHGPNGVGKTRVLELISAISWPLTFETLLAIPFRDLILEFSDASIFRIHKHMPEPQAAERSNQPKRLAFSFQFQRPGHQTINWTPRVDGPELRSSEALQFLYERREYTRLDRELRNRLAHSTTDNLEKILWEAAEGGEIPDFFRRLLSVNFPEPMQQLLTDLRVHLIDTHRLLVQPREEDRHTRVRRRVQTKVEEFAQDLSQRLARELAENSRTSQERDRTYPLRLLQTSLVGVASEQAIRDRYDAQEDLRRQLGEISLVDERSGVIEIPEEISPWQRAVLWTYLEDTEAKLDTFSDILARVSLLREIVNSRFLFKRLEIDRELGFRLVGDDGEKLGLASLSSGEQHELVLFYDLLFNVGSGALVLIDEPEISLHVSWQKRFISDLRQIADLVRFRTIVATHSPQIAGKWADRMVRLGPASE